MNEIATPSEKQATSVRVEPVAASGPLLLVILGAGASYDFSWRRTAPPQVIPYRIPLAKDLFNDVFGEQVNPASRGLMRRLRDAADKQPPQIEQELEMIREEAKEKPYLRRQLVGVQHYLKAVIERSQFLVEQSLPDGATNLLELVHEIEDWRGKQDGRVCFVTFNYDTLLEHACQSVINGFRISNINDYLNDSRYKIIKLHGSTDWIEAAPANPPRGSWITSGLDDVDTVWEVPREGSSIQLYGGATQKTFAFPAIALPTLTKSDRDFVCPPNHLEVLRDQVASAYRLLVVGWRGAEDHFQNIWRQSATGSINRWEVVDLDIRPDNLAGSDAKNRIRISLGLRGEEMFYYLGFSEFTKQFAVRAFLSS